MVIVSKIGVCAVYLGMMREEAISDFTRKCNASLSFNRGLQEFSSTLKALERYDMGLLKTFSVPLDLVTGTLFQRRVWHALQEIPYGKCVSYQWVAIRAGNPRAVRAVGNAVGKNPVPILIPCHRVIRKDGTLGGFSSGLHIKKALLEIEGCYENIILQGSRR